MLFVLKIMPVLIKYKTKKEIFKSKKRTAARLDRLFLLLSFNVLFF